MSTTKIGGPHRCNIHPEFEETDDVNEWNKHCQETEGHTITGTIACSNNCGNYIELEGIPYQPIGTELKLKCIDCYNDTQNLNRMVLENSISKQQQNNNNNKEGGN